MSRVKNKTSQFLTINKAKGGSVILNPGWNDINTKDLNSEELNGLISNNMIAVLEEISKEEVEQVQVKKQK